MSSSFIPLGSGEIIPWEVHPSLSLLHQLKLFNFPVPKGIILLAPPLSETGLTQEFCDQLLYELQVREFSTQLLVTCHLSGAGFHRETWNANQEELNALFSKIYEKISPLLADHKYRMDFLILERPEGLAFGKAFSKKGAIDDWIEFQLKENGSYLNSMAMPIDKLALGENPIRGDFRGRIQDLLRSTRTALGEDDWVLSWIDNRENTFLTGIANYTDTKSLGDLYVSIPNWNNTPGAPSPLQSSLILSNGQKLAHDYLRLMAEQENNRPFIIWSQNQLQFNFSFLCDFLRGFGLSTSALRVLPVIPRCPVAPFNGKRFWRSLPRFFRWCHELWRSPKLVRKLCKRMEAFQTDANKPFSQLFQEWQNVYVASSHLLYRLWNIFFLMDYILHFFGLPPLRPETSTLSSGKILVTVLSPFLSFRARVALAERQLKAATQKTLEKIEAAINMRALGWYSKGLLSSSDQIWSLSYQEICQKEMNELS